MYSALAFILLISFRYKAISGGKKSPNDQGELDGILKELGYSKDQVYKL